MLRALWVLGLIPGTAYDIGVSSNFTLFRRTFWDLSVINDFIHSRIPPLIPWWCNIKISYLWATSWNALLKSKRIKSVCLPDCIPLRSLSTSIIIRVSLDLFLGIRAVIQRKYAVDQSAWLWMKQLCVVRFCIRYMWGILVCSWNLASHPSWILG